MSSHALYEPMGLAKVTSWMIPTSSSCSLRLSRARRSEEARRRVSAAAIAVSSPCSLHGSSHEDGLHLEIKRCFVRIYVDIYGVGKNGETLCVYCIAVRRKHGRFV